MLAQCWQANVEPAEFCPAGQCWGYRENTFCKDVHPYRQMDGQPQNLMPPAYKKAEGIKKQNWSNKTLSRCSCIKYNFVVLLYQMILKWIQTLLNLLNCIENRYYIVAIPFSANNCQNACLLQPKCCYHLSNNDILNES